MDKTNNILRIMISLYRYTREEITTIKKSKRKQFPNKWHHRRGIFQTISQQIQRLDSLPHDEDQSNRALCSTLWYDVEGKTAQYMRKKKTAIEEQFTMAVEPIVNYIQEYEAQTLRKMDTKIVMTDLYYRSMTKNIHLIHHQSNMRKTSMNLTKRFLSQI